jgi:transposase
MKEIDIFTLALGLESPLLIKSVDLKAISCNQELHIEVGYEKGTTFEYEGQRYSIYDHQERTWRHLDFFQHTCYLHCRVPRIKTIDGKVILVDVPWSSPLSRFTLLFESHVLKLVSLGMSASGAGRHLSIGSKRVFGIIKRRVLEALTTQSLSPLHSVSVDETSSKKGHNYLTILSDNEQKKVVGIGIGKDTNAVLFALQEAKCRKAGPETVKTITMDMSQSFINAAATYFPHADIIFDRFHLMQHLNKAVDSIRREEQKQHIELKKSKYLWLRNNQDLNAEKQAKLELLAAAFPTIGLAHRLKESFREVLNNAKTDKNITWLNAWLEQAWDSEIPALQVFVNMINKHWYGIETYFQTLLTNAFAERVNLKIQEIKRTAKGFRNLNNFKYMIYFHLGKLNLNTHLK